MFGRCHNDIRRLEAVITLTDEEILAAKKKHVAPATTGSESSRSVCV